MKRSKGGRVVHLELHTGDLPRARAFYAALLGARFDEVVFDFGSYLTMDLGNGVGGGIVECGARPSAWLPYVEVRDIQEATDRARELGAAVLLEPREGPAGRRSVVTEPAGGQLALWESK
ncbi:MAG TPA: VOC family protein [Solirubrobacterales bacterium]|nr:VOC family protein [Solirubrobacterales bacterium]